MLGLGRAIDRGLYRAGRVWEDWSPLALFVVLVAAVFGLAGAIWVTVARYTGHDWHIFGVYVLSEFLLLGFASDKTKKIRDHDGEVLVWTIDAITGHSYILDLRDRMLVDALGAALWGGGIGVGLLIGTALVARIVHWRKVRQRRRRAGEKRTTLESQRRIGRRLKSALHSLSASVRFMRKSITRRAFAGSTKSGEAKPVSGNHHAADAAASDSRQQRRSPVSPAAFNDPTAGPPVTARPARQGRPNAAEAPPGEAHRRFDRRPDGEARLVARETPPFATSPPAPTASAPAAQSESADPSCPKRTNRMPHSQGQDSYDVGASKGGDSVVPETGAKEGHEVIARDNGSEDAASSAPQGERAATCDENRRQLGRPPRVTGPLGARKKRRKGSQDFY